MAPNNDIPLIWLENRHAHSQEGSSAAHNLLPDGVTHDTRAFHAQIPGYEMTPLKRLPHLASRLGLGSIWVKDESARMRLNAFKALGGSYAIYRFICQKLSLPRLSFAELMSDEIRARLGDITFASATDGNHGKGLAWATQKLGFSCVIYVHKQTSQARMKAISEYGAEVRVVDGNYDDAVRQCERDARDNGWQVISDTSWPGYEDIPRWVMQGYTTLLGETQEQLAAQGMVKPTHIFLQAGVGAFAAAMIAFYEKLFGAAAPISVVVEPRTAACLHHSMEIGDGQPHAVTGDLDTIMAGLACGEPSPLAWQILWDCADFIVTTPDYVAAKGMRMYGVPLKGDPYVISGESGAVTLGALAFIMEYAGAAALREKLQLDENSQVLLINTEGNTDPDYFRNVVWEGVFAVPEAYQWQPKSG
ncbi:MAG: diaminopropionate ammonia-lyase [Ardenticatenaceae bacterium]|nr:diaminopropionate ammonia-lyase [Anaerolineales bacterium]MCB8940423.1 diaminopropionate ammonia-lyase [Ardenticatenaceae bacterium]MCB8973439.1 diaminopropionate ammonia-lyase [Ardenticatenaceae bacterium]